MNPTLTIAIPTWHNMSQLSDCITTLINYTRFPYQVMIVDNGSDASMAENSKDWPNYIHYVDPGQNLGWMGGINYALERCDTPLFCMMNDDVMFIPDIRDLYDMGFWQKLTSHFSDDSVGLVGPASDFIAGHQAINASTALSFSVSVIMGVCIVGRTSFLKELGGLDETLPGGDDIDLCIRARQAGKSVRVDKRAFLHHLGQQSGRRAFGEYYDGVDHQEAVRNAIAAKHSLKECIEAFSFCIYEDLRTTVPAPATFGVEVAS